MQVPCHRFQLLAITVLHETKDTLLLMAEEEPQNIHCLLNEGNKATKLTSLRQYKELGTMTCNPGRTIFFLSYFQCQPKTFCVYTARGIKVFKKIATTDERSRCHTSA